MNSGQMDSTELCSEWTPSAQCAWCKDQIRIFLFASRFVKTATTLRWQSLTMVSNKRTEHL